MTNRSSTVLSNFWPDQVLASLVLGERDQWSDFGLVRPPKPDFPMEPVRWIGVKLVRRAIAKVDAADHAGR